MARLILKAAILFSFITIVNFTMAQGILDSLAPAINSENTNSQISQPLRVNPYSYRLFVKDSLIIAKIRDSYSNKWTQYDSLPSATQKYQPFYRQNNIEYLKTQSKPPLLTILFFILMVLVTIKFGMFRKKSYQEIAALFRNIAYVDWISEQLTLLNPFNLLSKIITTFGFSVLIAFVNFKIGFFLPQQQQLAILIILFSCFSYIILKYILAQILAFLFDHNSFVTDHFTHYQLLGALGSIINLVFFIIIYFMQGHWQTNVFILASLITWGIVYITAMLLFSLKKLANRNNKFFYLFFYLCALEILPILILSRWVAISYL